MVWGRRKGGEGGVRKVREVREKCRREEGGEETNVRDGEGKK